MMPTRVVIDSEGVILPNDGDRDVLVGQVDLRGLVRFIFNWVQSDNMRPGININHLCIPKAVCPILQAGLIYQKKTGTRQVPFR